MSEGTHKKFANIGIWNYYYIELQCVATLESGVNVAILYGILK